MGAAIEELRALGHGIYSRELRDGGLGHALRSLARSSPIAARVDAEEVGRNAPSVEEAVYFCAREAIQNAAKHAGTGTNITLSLQRGADALEFEIADDGCGFDARKHSDGYGLASMHDRLAAVGGELAIISAPGHGSRIRGRIPERATPTR